MEALVPEFKYGYVVGRFVTPAPDSADPDRLPDMAAPTGVKPKFTRVAGQYKQAIASPAAGAARGVLVSQGSVTTGLMPDGNVTSDVDNQGRPLSDATPGIWLIAGQYKVSSGPLFPELTIEVTEAHTEENPLDLSEALGYVPGPSEVVSTVKLPTTGAQDGQILVWTGKAMEWRTPEAPEVGDAQFAAVVEDEQSATRAALTAATAEALTPVQESVAAIKSGPVAALTAQAVGLGQLTYQQDRRLSQTDTLVFRDTFSRPDSATTVGAPWTISLHPDVATSNVWGIEGKAARHVSGGTSLLAVDAGSPDHEVSARIKIGTASDAGLLIRGSGTLKDFLYVTLAEAADQVRLGKRLVNVNTTLRASYGTTVTLTPGQTYEVRVQVIRDQIRVFVDGVKRITYTLSADDAAYFTGTDVGLISYTDFNTRWDQVTVRNLGLTEGPSRWNAANVATPQVTPTHEGSGQAVHPDVWDFGEGQAWNGYRYWMAMTPYPYSTESAEIPNILASQDGNTWVVPPGVTNPISRGFDPQISMVGNRMYVISQGYIVTWSDDGVTWEPWHYMFQQLAGEVSPSVLQEPDGTWRMWSIQKTWDGTRYRALHRTAQNITGPWSAPEEIILPEDLTRGRDLWHIDVVKHDGRYWTVFSEGEKGTSGGAGLLYLGESVDGLVWQVSAEPILYRGHPEAWDDALIYRSSIIPRGTGDGLWFDLWYSAMGSSGMWRIGRTELRRTRPQ